LATSLVSADAVKKIDGAVEPADVAISEAGKGTKLTGVHAKKASGRPEQTASTAPRDKPPKTIVAVNKDEEARIFELVGFGIVGDLHTVLPARDVRLRSRRPRQPCWRSRYDVGRRHLDGPALSLCHFGGREHLLAECINGQSNVARVHRRQHRKFVFRAWRLSELVTELVTNAYLLATDTLTRKQRSELRSVVAADATPYLPGGSGGPAADREHPGPVPSS